MFHGIYKGKRVLVTGHTGFKGSWLVLWLRNLGAEVCGFSLPPNTEPSHWEKLGLNIRSETGDIRNLNALKKVFAEFRPEMVFHLAAQPIVRLSYQNPVETFSSNVMGTVNVLEACRTAAGVKAAVVISSDKCYENRETFRGYTENDPMGGYDPYSASKGCTELAVSSYRRSFFNPADYGKKHELLLASARAGNVVGGGDWAADRLVPDLMRAAADGQSSVLRNPSSVRPWQHVLEPLSGYLALGMKLLKGDSAFAEGWNFGPAQDRIITVREAAAFLAASWDKIKVTENPPEDAPHEASFLRLDCTKAMEKLHWHGVWDCRETFERTAVWYRDFYETGTIRTEDDLKTYIASAEKEKLEWIK